MPVVSSCDGKIFRHSVGGITSRKVLSTGFNWMGQTSVANVNLWACVNVFGKGAVFLREIRANRANSKEERCLKYVFELIDKRHVENT